MADLEQALRSAFPHFQNEEPVTAEAIMAIGKEYMDLVMDPGPREIEFQDCDGKTAKIIQDDGDSSVGIQPGWVLQYDLKLVKDDLSLTDERLIEIALCAWCGVQPGTVFTQEDLAKYGRAEGWGRVVKAMKEALL